MRRAPNIIALAVASGIMWPSAANASPAQHYEAGVDKYEAGDFPGAIESWETARGEMQDATPRARALMELNIATAYERAYDTHGDREALEAAAKLTRSFLSRVPGAFAAQEVALEEQRARDRLARIEGKLAQVPAQTQTAALAPPAVPEQQTGPNNDPRGLDSHPGRGLIAGGATTLGVGIVGLSVMTAGLVMAARANDFSDVDPELDRQERQEQIKRGNTGNSMAITGLIMAAVAVPTGAALLAVGVRRKRAAGTQARVVPALGPGHAGLLLQGTF